jgi:hypothetical protein
MKTKHVMDLSEITLGEAETMKKAGAVLELRADGKMIIYTNDTEKKRLCEHLKGGWDDERDADHG